MRLCSTGGSSNEETRQASTTDHHLLDARICSTSKLNRRYNRDLIMRIGELARRSGISERMLRYYEQEGLLRPIRTESGYRDYSAGDVKTAQRIRSLSATGFKIEIISILLPSILDIEPCFLPSEEVRAALRQEVEKLDEKLRHLNESRHIVVGYLKKAEASGSG
jgi:DNA-binding transcriptional MerR regulator